MPKLEDLKWHGNPAVVELAHSLAALEDMGAVKDREEYIEVLSQFKAVIEQNIMRATILQMTEVEDESDEQGT